MNKPKINHQILYAKNFYAHSGNIISDMRKVCKLDEPNWDFSSPKQILKFMRKQYNLWLENNPEIHRDGENRVHWDDNPVSSEMWSYIIAYSIFIPMTMIHGYIPELPRYDVLRPQYNAHVYGEHKSLINKSMSIDEMKEKVNSLFHMSNLEVMDMLADELVKKFNFKAASELLSMFGENVTAKELDEELWNAYSYLVEDNLDEDGNLPEKTYVVFTDHFHLKINPVFKPGEIFDMDVDLIPFKFQFESLENIRGQIEKCTFGVINQFKDSGAMYKISKVCTELYDDCRNELWDVPQHLAVTESELYERMVENTDAKCAEWDWLGWTNESIYKRFQESDNANNPFGFGSGCFTSYIYNDNGHMRVLVTFETIFDCNVMEKELRNGMWIDERKS